MATWKARLTVYHQHDRALEVCIHVWLVQPHSLLSIPRMEFLLQRHKQFVAVILLNISFKNFEIWIREIPFWCLIAVFETWYFLAWYFKKMITIFLPSNLKGFLSFEVEHKMLLVFCDSQGKESLETTFLSYREWNFDKLSKIHHWSKLWQNKFFCHSSSN